MEEWKKAGVRVIPVVASTALAKRMEKAGADAVIAEGTESGGHIGETTTMALVPQVVDAVNIHVLFRVTCTGCYYLYFLFYKKFGDRRWKRNGSRIYAWRKGYPDGNDFRCI